jgi:hypothetical protein
MKTKEKAQTEQAYQAIAGEKVEALKEELDAYSGGYTGQPDYFLSKLEKLIEYYDLVSSLYDDFPYWETLGKVELILNSRIIAGEQELKALSHAIGVIEGYCEIQKNQKAIASYFSNPAPISNEDAKALQSSLDSDRNLDDIPF